MSAGAGPKPVEPVERRVKSLLRTPRPYLRAWLDEAEAVVAEVERLRRRCQRLHRRSQQAEALAHREGRRADRMAQTLRRQLTSATGRHTADNY